MAKAKVQESAVSIRTWSDADEAMQRCASKQTLIAIKRAEMDAEILAITEKYADSVGNAELILAANEQALERFASDHKAEFKAAPDGDGRSYGHAGITIGFRKLLDKVALPRGEAKKEVSLEYLEQYRPEFVRRTPEFDLVALLAALKDGDSDLVKALADHGITLRPGKDEFFLKVATEK